MENKKIKRVELKLNEGQSIDKISDEEICKLLEEDGVNVEGEQDLVLVQCGCCGC